ncbi:MAG TPA: HD domain-containing phosphohydrolase [Candidatus Sulfotelmatobacter sp.]|nr:HD domain-containing phosphohydrolase [Candidatus Sulfotelmatobacter sp.]
MPAGENLLTEPPKPRILFVDDEPAMLESLRRSVRREFEADVAIDADHGLDYLRSGRQYCIVVSDMRMPVMDGVEFLATVRTISPDSVRVMLTGCDDMGVAVRAVNDGCIFKFLSKPVPTEVLLACLRDCVTHYVGNREQKHAMASTVRALEQLDIGTLTAFARAIDANSPWTSGHSERVTKLALRIAHAMGLSAKDLQIVHRGSLLHDIGKIGTPPAILDKPGTLKPRETEIMRNHVKVGIRILEPIDSFKDLLGVVAQHHERFDGSGYPAGLAGDQICLHARIVAVADAYDALTSDRPYRKSVPEQKAIEILKEHSGTQFDPKVVDALITLSIR